MANEELVILYQSGDSKALEILIEQNIGIVKKIANKFYNFNCSIEFEDMIQEGIIGLMIAAKRYDFNNPRKANFIVYAVYWIYKRIYSIIIGETKNQRKNNEFYNKCTSLNVSIGEEEDTELIELVKDIDYSFENVEERIYNQQLRIELEEIMNKYITLKEQEILKFRYGWNTKILTLKEIGEILNIKGERVRQIENRGLRKLRNSEWGKERIKEQCKAKNRAIQRRGTSPSVKLERIDYISKYFDDVE